MVLPIEAAGVPEIRSVPISFICGVENFNLYPFREPKTGVVVYLIYASEVGNTDRSFWESLPISNRISVQVLPSDISYEARILEILNDMEKHGLVNLFRDNVDLTRKFETEFDSHDERWVVHSVDESGEGRRFEARFENGSLAEGFVRWMNKGRRPL